jgi:hypothetical protein
MQQLQFLKPTLLEKINAFLGKPLIQDIRFKLGKISRTMPASTKTHSLEDQKLDKATLKRIESLLEEIGDEEVRKSMREVLIKGAVLERSRKESP